MCAQDNYKIYTKKTFLCTLQTYIPGDLNHNMEKTQLNTADSLHGTEALGSGELPLFSVCAPRACHCISNAIAN